MKSKLALAAIPISAANNLRGISTFCTGVFIFSTMYVVIKSLDGKFPTVQLIFFRSVFAFVPILPFLIRSGLSGLRTERPWGHAWRSAAGLTAMLCGFTALSLMPIADVTALMFAMPLFVTALSVPLLAEPVGWRRWTAVAVGFVGIVVILRPAALLDPETAIGWYYFLPLGGALCYGLATIALRQLGATETPISTVFYFTLSTAVVTTVLLPFFWVWPDGIEWLQLIAIGLCGGVGQFFLVGAFRYAPAAVIVPFDYTAMIWSVSFGYLFWAEVPDTTVVIGSAVVIGAGLYIIFREAQVARRETAKPAAPPTA